MTRSLYIIEKPVRKILLSIRRAAGRFIYYYVCNKVTGDLLALLLKDRIPNSGCIIDTSYDIVAPQIKMRLFLGFYERTEIRFVKQYLRTDLDVVELGSSLGVLTSHIARKLDPSRQIICIEANPSLLAVLRMNIDHNATHTKTHIIHGALDYSKDNRTSVDLVLSEDSTESRVVENATSKQRIHVPTTTLSKVLAQYQVSEYSLVADIEGAEAGLLKNEGKALASCRQLIIELHETMWDGQRVQIADMCKVLEEQHGFTICHQYESVFVFERKPA